MGDPTPGARIKLYTSRLGKSIETARERLLDVVVLGHSKICVERFIYALNRLLDYIIGF